MSDILLITIALGALALIFAVLTIIFIVLWRKEKAKGRELKEQYTLKEKEQGSLKEKEQGTLKEGKSVTATDVPDTQKAEGPSAAEKPGELALLLKKYADRFGGLYESLYRIVNVPDNFSADVFDEFYQRALLISDNAFQRAFLRAFPSVNPDDIPKNMKDSERLLCLIDSAGITRDSTDVIENLAPDDINSYLDEKGSRPSEGKTYQVLSPAWRCDGKTVEEGLLITVTK